MKTKTIIRKASTLNNSNKEPAMKTVKNFSEIKQLNIDLKAKEKAIYKNNQRKTAAQQEAKKQAIARKKAERKEAKPMKRLASKISDVALKAELRLKEIATLADLSESTVRKAFKQDKVSQTSYDKLMGALDNIERILEEEALMGRNSNLGVKAQDLSVMFHAYAETQNEELELYGIDDEGNITSNGFEFVSEDKLSTSRAKLLEIARRNYSGELSEEVAVLFAEQFLDNEEKTQGFTKTSREGEVSLHFEKSFTNKAGETIWFKLTEKDLGLGRSHKILNSKRNENGAVELFESRKPATFSISLVQMDELDRYVVSELIQENANGEFSLNLEGILEIANNLWYASEYSFEPVELGFGFRAVLSHPELYKVVGFNPGSEFSVVEVEESGVYCVQPNNIWVADSNSFADIANRKSKAEILYGRSAELMTRNAEDVYANYAEVIRSKAEEAELKRISARDAATVQVRNNRINAALALNPDAKKHIMCVNNIFEAKAYSELKAYIGSMSQDELKGMMDYARAVNSDSVRLAFERDNFHSPYILVKNAIRSSERKEASLKKSRVDSMVLDIIKMINEDAANAMALINANKGLAAKIVVAAQSGARINNKSFYSAINSLTNREEIEAAREELNANAA